MNNKTIYVLSNEDAQNVAQQEIGRELTFSEIQRIKDCIADKINWYDAISDAINENIITVS